MSRLDMKDRYHMLFWHETQEQIRELEATLLLLEDAPQDTSLYAPLFRLAHSIKGASATMGFLDFVGLTHELESLFDALQKGDLYLDEAVFEVLFSCCDALSQMHATLLRQDPEEVDQGGSPKNTRLLATLSAIREPRKVLDITFTEDCQLIAIKVYQILQALAPLAKVVEMTPANATTEDDDEVFNHHVMFKMETQATEAQLQNQLKGISELVSIHLSQPTDVRRIPESIKDDLPKKDLPKKDLPKKESPLELQYDAVKVPLSKIDEMINLVSDLMLHRSALTNVVTNLKMQLPQSRELSRLSSIAESLHLLGSTLQEVTLSTRMLPLDMLFSKFSRLVRDVSKALNKEIDLQILGADHSLDRTVLEALHDPITHLLRNAIDHGIETTHERLAQGKSATGTIRLTASQGDDHILITLEDDGKGIDLQQIASKAMEKGLVTFEEAQYYQEEDWLNMLFRPGFTTQTEASTLSGRGVGLDVVKENIQRINGHIDIKTQVGRGTLFSLKVPLTLAILKALVVSDPPYRFAIPLGSVHEVISLSDLDHLEFIYQTQLSQVLHWRGMALPLLSLAKHFNFTRPPFTPLRQTIMVLSSGDRYFALYIERVLFEEELVVKSMGHYIGPQGLFGHLKGILGCGLLGDSSICYVLDTSSLLVDF